MSATKAPKKPFANPFNDQGYLEGFDPRSVYEWIALEFESEIRCKPNWWTKIEDSEIVGKWKQEMRTALQQRRADNLAAEKAALEASKDGSLPASQYEKPHLPDDQIDRIVDYVIRDTAQFKHVIAESRHGTSAPALFDGKVFIAWPGFFSSDDKQTLRQEVRKLLDAVGQENYDFHPGSDGQVLDIVHPSLHMLLYGTSVVISPSTGQLAVAEVDVEAVKKSAKPFYHSESISEHFQWIPADLLLGPYGAEFTSYINNLDPIAHSGLYSCLEKLFARLVPGLDAMLTVNAAPEFVRVEISGDACYKPEFNEKLQALQDDNWDDWEELYESRSQKDLIDLTPEKLYTPPKAKFSLLTGTADFPLYGKLKVITKLATIHLTPEKPRYAGGSWHVEGAPNEDIIASAIYYYDSDNITESRLAFRAQMADPPYEQGDDFACRFIWELEDEQLMVRNVGSVRCDEDCAVLFPNSLQHKVEPFELKDRSKPGHRSIVCFFLVDPYNEHVVTTSRVVPPQAEWWQKYEFEGEGKGKEGKEGNEEKELKRITNFKQLLQKDRKSAAAKLALMPWPLEFAKAKRAELMEERSAKPQDPDSYYDQPYYRNFSLCEH